MKTAVRYKDMLKRINAEIGPIKLQDLRPDHLNRLYAKLAEPGQNKTGGGLSARPLWNSIGLSAPYWPRR